VLGIIPTNLSTLGIAEIDFQFRQLRKALMLDMAEVRSEIRTNFPTVLGLGLCGDLLNRLRLAGYHVLEAHNREDAVVFVRTHSRPIHLALLHESFEDQGLTTLLRRYRPNMFVLSAVQDRALSRLADESAFEVILKNVHKLFESVADRKARELKNTTMVKTMSASNSDSRSVQSVLRN
jgi:hypothetical protein